MHIRSDLQFDTDFSSQNSIYVCLRQFMYAWDNLCMPETIYVCLRQFMYAWDNLCMPETIYVCLRQFMYAWDNLCMPETIYVCLRQFMYAWDNLCMPETIYVCLRQFATWVMHSSSEYSGVLRWPWYPALNRFMHKHTLCIWRLAKVGLGHLPSIWGGSQLRFRVGMARGGSWNVPT